jgi:transposase-like protein
MSNSAKKNFDWEEKEKVISEWKQSGVSKKQFAEDRGIKYHTFVGWFKRAGNDNTARGFSEVAVSSSERVLMEVVTRDKTIRIYQLLPAEYFQWLVG